MVLAKRAEDEGVMTVRASVLYLLSSVINPLRMQRA